MDFNKELEKEINEFHKKREMEHFNNILNILPYCILRTPTYLEKDPRLENGKIVINKNNSILFSLIEDPEEKKYLPVFTSQEEYKKMPNIEEASIYHLEFHHIIDIFTIEHNVSGIAINPTSKNVVIDKDLLLDLDKILKDLGNKD